jgi:hypothetical protein
MQRFKWNIKSYNKIMNKLKQKFKIYKKEFKMVYNHKLILKYKLNN